MNARRLLLPLFLLSILLLLVVGSSGCGDKNKGDVKSPTAEPSMDDALALLPGNAIGAGTVDARAFFGSQTFGADLARLVEKYVPIGAEAGFQASRDVDRVTSPQSSLAASTARGSSRWPRRRPRPRAARRS
jgi:hypothetical protein